MRRSAGHLIRLACTCRPGVHCLCCLAWHRLWLRLQAQIIARAAGGGAVS